MLRTDAPPAPPQSAPAPPRARAAAPAQSSGGQGTRTPASSTSRGRSASTDSSSAVFFFLGAVFFGFASSPSEAFAHVAGEEFDRDEGNRNRASEPRRDLSELGRTTPERARARRNRIDDAFEDDVAGIGTARPRDIAEDELIVLSSGPRHR